MDLLQSKGPLMTNQMAKDNALIDYYGAQMEQMRNQPAQNTMNLAMQYLSGQMNRNQQLKLAEIEQRYKDKVLGETIRQNQIAEEANRINRDIKAEDRAYKRAKEVESVANRNIKTDLGLYEGGSWSPKNQQKHRIYQQISSKLRQDHPEWTGGQIYNEAISRTEKEFSP